MILSIIYGTRPEYLKILPLIHELQQQTVLQYNIIRILQHNNLNEIDLYSNNIVEINNDNYNRLDSLGSQILMKLSKYIIGSDYVIVQGDTATAFYTALCAFQNNIKIAHLEAGMRTYDINNPYPEEAYRQMISRMASVHFTPHQYNLQVLNNERVYGDIITVGNTILDLIKSYNLTISRGNKILITFHRRENNKYLEHFIKELIRCIEQFKDKEFYWFLHPNKELQGQIKELTYQYMNRIHFIEPCNHRIFLDYLKDCYCILTDSGGIQEEASFLGKCSIVLRNDTERDQIKYPYLQLVKPPFNLLIDSINKIPDKDLPPNYVYGKGNTSLQIINYFLKL